MMCDGMRRARCKDLPRGGLTDWPVGPQRASAHATMPSTGEENDQRTAAEAQTQQNVRSVRLTQRCCCNKGKAAASPGVLMDVEELMQPANLLRISN